MLQQICEYLHNFDFQKGREFHCGTYEIADGVITPLDFLLEGQRFQIVNSVFNDGLYTYHAEGIRDDDDNAFAEGTGLQDERFAGTICALAVPPAVIALSEEISQWVEDNGEAVNSPYTSESVLGVYSYTKGTGGTGAGGAIGWQDVFKNQLSRWRKIAF